MNDHQSALCVVGAAFILDFAMITKSPELTYSGVPFMMSIAAFEAAKLKWKGKSWH